MKKIFNKNLDYILFVLTAFVFVIICGYSEAGIKKIPQLPNSAIIQNTDLLVFENLATNKTNNIAFEDLVLNFPLSNIYANDGTLTGNRILDGDNYNHALDFTDLSSFNIYATDFYSESQAGNTIENGATGIDLQAMGTGQTLTLQGDIVNLGGVTDTYVSFLNQDDTQNKVLVLDGSDKLFWRDASSFANNIYTEDGTLTNNRTLDGDSSAYNLNLVNINNIAMNAISIGSYTQDYTQFESDGNVNLIAGGDFNASSNSAFNMYAGNSFDIQANESILAQAGQNINLFNVPDWSTTQDLEGMLYSGDDVLGVNAILGLAPNEGIKGAGFFTKRNSSGNYSYIFAGNSSDVGGEANEIGFGMTDFGATDFNAGYSLTRDDITLNPYYDFYLQDGNGNYGYDYRIDVPNEIYEEYNNYVADISHSKTLFETGFSYSYSNFGNGSEVSFFYDENNQELSLVNSDSSMLSKVQLNRDSMRFIAEDIGGAIVNYVDFGFESFSIKNLNDYLGGEKVLVHDSSGDVRKSIAIESFQIRKNTNIVSANTTASPNDLIVYQGGNLGAPFTHTITLPAGTDKDEVTVKVYSSDVLRVDVIGGGTIDGATFIDIDGTLLNKPSLTFYYSATLSTWLII